MHSYIGHSVIKLLVLHCCTFGERTLIINYTSLESLVSKLKIIIWIQRK